MKITYLPFDQYRQMRWRNGGGNARDIAVDPATAGMADAVSWRVALAEIEQDGPFSIYEPQIDRIITLLDGNGFDLDFTGAPGITIAERFVPARFRGEWPAMCRLRLGRSVVINVLYDDRILIAQTHIVRLPANQPVTFSPTGRTTIIFSLTGRFNIDTRDQPTTSSSALSPWDSLRIDLDQHETPLLTLRAALPDSQLLLIGFDPR